MNQRISISSAADDTIDVDDSRTASDQNSCTCFDWMNLVHCIQEQGERGSLLNINSLHKKALCGDNLAEQALFGALSERLEQFALHRIWNREDARDIVQETMLSIVREYKQIEFRTSFSAWAYKVLDNRILDYLKRKRLEQGRSENMADPSGSPDMCPDLNPELRLRLLDCLRKICDVNGKYARIINLHYQGYTTGEICDKMTLTRNTLYITLYRARKMLEICLRTGDIVS